MTGPETATAPAVTVIGPVTLDETLAVDALPPAGGSAVATATWTAAGGKGGSPARAVALLGADCRLVGAVGDDAVGRWVRGELAEAGVDAGGVEVLPGIPTGRTVHLVEPGGARRYVEVVGANGHLSIDPDGLRDYLLPGSVLLASTALPATVVAAAVTIARDQGAMVVVDLAGPADTSAAALGVPGGCDVVRADASEAAELTGVEVRDFDSAVVAARRLLDQGAHLAVVQAGGDGNVVVGRELAASGPAVPGGGIADRGWGAEIELRLPTIDRPTRDPTGAGDAFVAVLAVGLLRGGPVERWARLANAAAAHTAAVLGATPRFDLAELTRLAQI